MDNLGERSVKTDIRRWQEGQIAESCGLVFRVVKGVKSPEDLRIELRADDGTWWPVKMELVFLLTDFFCENERILKTYRPHWKREGDEFFLEAVRVAAKNGWREAADQVVTARERLAKRTVVESCNALLNLARERRLRRRRRNF